MENVNTVCILILTCNRHGAVDYYLEKKLKVFKENNFDVVIYDSSADDLTEKVIQKYVKEGQGCLKYVRYKDPAGDIYGTKKSRDALVACADNYEYVWLCGDTAVLLLEEYQDDLSALLNEKYDLIHIYDNKRNIDSCQNMDYRDFFENFYWSMTHWCAFILSKRLIREMDKWMRKYLEMNYVTVVSFAIFAALPGNDFRIAYMKHVLFEISPCRVESTSHGKKDILRGWAQVVNTGINHLPDEYDEVKASAKIIANENVGLFTRQGAIDLRADENITLKKLLKYGEHLKQVTDVPIAWFYLWSLMPKKIARIFSDNYGEKEAEKRLEVFNRKGIKLVIYGAGKHGKRILNHIKYAYDGIRVIAVSDRNWNNVVCDYPVISPGDICSKEYDYVGIAIVNKKVFKEVKRELIGMGVAGKQIIQV